MKKGKILLSGLILIAAMSFALRFKNIGEDFGARVSGYYHEKIGNTLFLHTDKSIYIPNESIWFKAYILNSFIQHEVLYLRLINAEKQIVLQKEFPVYDIRAHGDMLIPITMPAGRYTLVAYTDKMINYSPELVFTKQIQVIKDQSADWKAEALIADSTAFSPGKTPEIMVKVSGVNGLEIAKAKGTYQIYTKDKKPIADGKFLTGPTGVAAINFSYPAITATEDLFLECKITDREQTKELHIRLPKNPAMVLASCYPEGGHLINGISNTVFIETTDAGGQPVAAKVVLKSEKRPVITATTNAEGYATIAFTPDPKEKYSLAISSPGYSGNVAFPLKIDPAGYVIRLTGPADHPALVVKNQNMPGNVVLLGRTLSELILNKPLTIKSGDSVQVPLPQNDSVNHIVDLGLFDEGNKLLAERLVYLPVPEKYHVAVDFTKSNYTSREKVRAAITVTDANGHPVSANLSVAVVAEQTLDPLAEQQITQTDLYTLQHYNPKLREIGELNNELIREHIRSGNWPDVISYQLKGRINTLSNAAGVFGFVTSKKKNKKIDLKTLYLYGHDGLTEVPVSETGVFSIPAKDLVTGRGDTKYLIINKDFNDIYDLHIKNYAADFDSKLALVNFPGSLPVFNQAGYSPQLAAVMSGKILNEVVIKGTKSTPVTPGDFNVTDYHSPNCSDYVCFYNVLNCKNHPGGGSPPVEGQIYVLNGRPIRYHECSSNEEKTNIYKVKNIDSPRDFYLPDYEKEPVSTPELQSTIFWAPNANTQANGKTSIEFYTIMVKGAFTIIVQGLTMHGLAPVFGKSEFKVIPKNGASSK